MHKVFVGLVVFLFFHIATVYGEEYILIADNQTGAIVFKQGSDKIFNERVSPWSTFKIALSLMGYDTKILQDENTPEWPYLNYEADEPWRMAHTPARWMDRSCVWYSRVLTQKLGMKQLKKYVFAFSYGNQDLSGDRWKNNGLTNAWLGSSLKISMNEKIVFLTKLVRRQIPVSSHALAMTKKLMLFGEIGDGWTMYGKTGTGPKNTLCWLDGWIEKNKQIYVFTLCIRNTATMPSREDRIALVKKFLAQAKLPPSSPR